MRRGKNNESTILLEDFNAHVRNDAGVRKGVISQRGDTTVNGNRRQLWQRAVRNEHSLQHWHFRKYIWCRESMDQRSLIDFCMVTAYLL